MFARYLQEICQDTLAAENLQFLTRVKFLKELRKDTQVIAGGNQQQQTLQMQECPSLI